MKVTEEIKEFNQAMEQANIAGIEAMIGKQISRLDLTTDDELIFTFNDGSRIKLFDDGQSCCENRYMCTDDNLSQFVDATLLGAKIRQAPDEPDEYGVHEVQFLLVITSAGVFTMVSHNEHNGYYGGFSIRLKQLT